MTLISSTIPLVPMQTMDGRTVYTKPGALGCPDCGGGCGMGAVSDYDQITIGGKTYTVNQIIDKVITANREVTAYSSPGGKALFKIQAGEPIGRAFSHLRPDQSKDGRAWLMFEKSYNDYFFVPADGAASKPLEEQGALTVHEEIKKEQEELERQNNPVGYYLKKYGLPALLIVGGIVVLSGVAKETVKGAFTKQANPKPVPALAGPKKRKRKVKVIHL